MTPYRPSILLPPTHIIALDGAQNKKRAFEQSALLMENLSGLPRNELFRQFMQREKQGSTALGENGTAIPHIRRDIATPLCALIKLATPLQYDADNSPASSVRTMLPFIAPAAAGKTPEDARQIHLNLLAMFSMMLSDATLAGAIDNAAGADDIHAGICEWESRSASALNDLWADDEPASAADATDNAPEVAAR